MNIIMTSITINLALALYVAWLQKRVSKLAKENDNKKRELLQKALQIDALERRPNIEIANQRDGTDLDERLRTKQQVENHNDFYFSQCAKPPK